MDRERDKERLENKRKQDQLKKLFDEEKEENKKKLMEVLNGLKIDDLIVYFYNSNDFIFSIVAMRFVGTARCPCEIANK